MALQNLVKRVVTCQGTIQLVTALSVLNYREKEQRKLKYSYENYLAIYDLYAPSGQLDAFVATIEKMARQMLCWKNIVYITPEQIKAIAGKLNSTGSSKIFRLVRDLVGVDTADEIYLCRNWQFGHQLLINTYQSAQKICYGDSIGLYFSSTSTAFYPVLAPDLKQPEFDLLASLKNKVKPWIHFIKEKANLKTMLKTLEFDIGYFVLPDVLGELPPMETVTLDRQELLEVLKPLIALVDPTDIANFTATVADRSIFILLTSNFSEAGRMSLENEIFAYRQFLMSENRDSNPVLLIKPHPRDSKLKIEKLKDNLSDLFPKILTLSEPHHFFLPFEIFFMAAFLHPDFTHKNKIKVFAVSSACLSLKLLFNISSVVGFGEHITSKLFYEEYAVGRLEHESHLKLAVKDR